MSLIVKDDTLNEQISRDIPRRKFELIARLVAYGKDSLIDSSNRQLLCDLFEGRIKVKRGRPREDNFDLAEELYDEFSSFRYEGKKYEDAISIVAGNHNMGEKNVERLIIAYREYERQIEEIRENFARNVQQHEGKASLKYSGV